MLDALNVLEYSKNWVFLFFAAAVHHNQLWLDLENTRKNLQNHRELKANKNENRNKISCVFRGSAKYFAGIVFNYDF